MEGLIFYVVFEDQKHLPGKFYIKRKHMVPQEHGPAKDVYEPELFAIADTLEAVRKRLPFTVILIGRMGEDDPKIKEVWF
jgi:hypothetical protein